MTIRALGPMAGIGWLTRAINAGRSGPGAVFGGAALMLVVVMAAAIAAGVLQVVIGVATGQSMTGMVIGMVIITAVVLAVMAMMMVGFLRLLDKVERGIPASAVDVFAGFGDFPTSLRTVGFMVMLTILQYIILGAILAIFARGFFAWYMELMQASMSGGDPTLLTQLPSGMGIGSLAMAVIGIVFYGVQAIGLGQVVLGGRSAFAALGDGFVGAFKNLLPLLVFVLASIGAMIVLSIAVFIIAMVIGLLAKFVGVWLGVLLAIPLYFGGLLAMFVVMVGVMYHLWRDVCGGDERTDIDTAPVSTVTI